MALQQDIRTFLQDIQKKKLTRRDLFAGQGQLTTFLGREKDATEEIPEEQHEEVAAKHVGTPSFRTYLRIKERPERVRAKQRLLQRKRKPMSEEARKRARMRRALAAMK